MFYLGFILGAITILILSGLGVIEYELKKKCPPREGGVEKKISYAYYCLENAIRHEREGTNIEGHEKDVDIYLSQIKEIIKSLKN